VGYWVDDLASAVDDAIVTLDVGPFLVHPHVRFRSFTWADGTEVSDPAYFDHSAAFAAWGPLVLELGQVHSADPRVVEAYGLATRSVGHVSWIADDLGAESARLESLGCRLLHTASLGPVLVAWHDGGPLFPHPIEVHRGGGPVDAMHQRLRELADGWDGTDPMRPMAALAPAPPEERSEVHR
jgi:hypothetical protein